MLRFLLPADVDMLELSILLSMEGHVLIAIVKDLLTVHVAVVYQK
jgi:hypothetical protein